MRSLPKMTALGMLAAALAVPASTASAQDPVCTSAGKGVTYSAVCVDVDTHGTDGELQPHVWVGCSLLGERAECYGIEFPKPE